MTQAYRSPIGTPGTPWQQAEKQQWLAQQQIQRSYQQQVVEQLIDLPDSLETHQYGRLHYQNKDYPLYVVRSKHWQASLPTVLITGGVHGYETSGVQGALRFALLFAQHYLAKVNLVIAPCLSPWGYETINRWNPAAIDPNRSFYADSPAPEAKLLIDYLTAQQLNFLAHFDLHETTNSDNSEFRPTLAARDGIEQTVWQIPDGFYLVGDSEAPQADFQRAIIESVEQVTHIAPPDAQNRIIGAPLEQHGVINYPKAKLGLCGRVTNAPFVTTTEVYPDSPRVDDENCIQAQVAAIIGGLDFLLTNNRQLPA